MIKRGFKTQYIGANEARKARFRANYEKAMAIRTAKYAANRAIIPGLTRTTLSYRRSNPAFRGIETHYNDCSFNETCLRQGNSTTFTSISPTAGAPVNPADDSLNLISQGTTKNQRIGNKLNLYAIRIRGEVTVPTNASSIGSDWVRIVLVLDKQANGAVANVADVFEPTAAATTDLNAHMNMDNVDRFKIVKDRLIIPPPSGYGTIATGQASIRLPFKLNHKCQTEIVFSSTTGVITEVRSNNWILFCFSSTSSSSISGKSRVYWKE